MKTLALGIIAAAFAFGASTGAAEAVPSELRDHKPVNDGLAYIAAADMIRKECDTIESRLIRAYRYIKSLESRARADGFSDEEIDAFVDSEEDKSRIEGVARNYLLSKGVKLDQPQTFCVAGEYEIDRNSQIGVLLRSK